MPSDSQQPAQGEATDASDQALVTSDSPPVIQETAQVPATSSPAPIDEAGSVPAPPGGPLKIRERDKGSTRHTRRFIAYALVVILFMLVATGCWGWLFMDRDKVDFQAYAVMFSPIVTLVGTVLAFYFGSKDD